MTDKITQLPLTALRESPTNPRKKFNPESLAELAGSLQTQGLLQPIVVRPIEGEVFTYEIVFGHRRFRAARLAEFIAVNCIVREMTDDQVALAQVHENLERDDISPMEEADAFQQLRRVHGVTPEEIHKSTGTSLSYVYDRLRLATVSNEIRAAVDEGTIGAQIAVELARVPNPLQAEALKRSTYISEGQYVAQSYRQVKAIVKDYSGPLEAEEFDLAEAGIADQPACLNCPRNSTNSPELREHYGEKVCTNTICRDQKRVVFWGRLIDQARADGRHVIEGEEAAKISPSGHWLTYTHHDVRTHMVSDPETQARVTLQALIESALKDDIAVDRPSLLVYVKPGFRPQDVYSREQVDALMAAIKPDYDEMDDDHGQEPAAAMSLEHQAVYRVDQWTPVRDAIMRAAVIAPRTRDDLLLMAERELEMADSFGRLTESLLGWPDNIESYASPRTKRLELLRSMSADQLAALLTLVAIEEAGGMDEDGRECRLALARRYGVDVLQVAGLASTGSPEGQEALALPLPGTPAGEDVGAEKSVEPTAHEGSGEAQAPTAQPKGKGKKMKDKASSAGQEEQKDEAADAAGGVDVFGHPFSSWKRIEQKDDDGAGESSAEVAA